MTSDDLRALLDAAAKATPGKWKHGSYFVRGGLGIVARVEDDNDRAYIAAASPDVVAALARIALAAAEWDKQFDRPVEAYDTNLFNALREEGLR